MIASAVLLILSFPNFNLWPLAWVALVPLLYAIEGQKPSRAFLKAYICGVIFFSGTVYWLIHVTMLGMILAVLYLALYFGLFGLAVSLIPRRTAFDTIFVIPVIWVATEWLRANLLTGFGWVLLSHSQSHTLPVIQIADIFGAYGVSFLIAMVNAAVYVAFTNRKKREYFEFPILIVTMILFTSLLYGSFRLKNIFPGDVIKVSVIQGNIPQDKKWDQNFREEILAKYERLTKEAAADKPDLIVWPETSVPGFLESEEDLNRRVKALAVQLKAPLLVGTIREERHAPGVYYNSAAFVLPDGTIKKMYDKIHLVPFGEYIPLKNIFSFVEKIAPAPIGDVSKGKDYTVFSFFAEKELKSKEAMWRSIKKIKFSALICFEDVFPELAREFVKRDARFLVNMTNDAWYKHTSAPYQHAESSVFRAVENRVNVIRATNTGLSCFIDQKGRVSGIVSEGNKYIFVEGHSTAEIVLTRTRTPYNRYGDMPLLLLILTTYSAYVIVSFKLKGGMK